MDIKKAIEHYNYGISHDIFSEPIITYARLAVDALEKQVDKKPVVLREFGTAYGKEYYACPNCYEYIRYKYTLEKPTYPCRCGYCGQALVWDD